MCSNRRTTHLTWLAALAAIAPQAIAGVTYLQSSSSATIIHDANSSSGGVDVTKNLAPPPSSSMTLYQLNSSIGTSPQSVAKASVGAVTNTTTATFTLGGGSGVTQIDPGHVWNPSIMRATVNGVWQGTSPSFGPVATGYFSLGYAGSVGGAGSFAKVIINLSFLNAVTNAVLRPAISYTDTITASGSFAKTYTNSYAFSGGALGNGSKMKITGSIEFQAQNDGGTVELYPVNSNFGGAPPTATWQVDGSGNWDAGSAANWTPGAGTTIDDANGEIPAIPNSIGVRARFANLSLAPGGPRTINVTSPITVGALDISDNDPLTFTAAPLASLTFQVQQGDATMQTGDSDGGSDVTLLAPVNLVSSVEVQTSAGEESFSSVPQMGPPSGGNPNHSSLKLMGQVNGMNPEAGLIKTGDGLLVIDGPTQNNFSGGVKMQAGTVDANKPLAMGTGLTSVNDSRLNYNSNLAAPTGVFTQQLGEMNVGDTVDVSSPAWLNEHFGIGDLSGIRGNALELQSLSNGQNMEISPGAMIVHETFDTGTIGNPQGISNNPTYVFGVANNFDGISFAFGSDVLPGSWRGFGSDRGHRIFGSSLDVLTVGGNGELVSLAGSLNINARLDSSGPANLAIRGGGCIFLNHPSNTFTGNINVQSGTLLIMGDVSGAAISVIPGDGLPAMLGGTGNISNAVTVGNGGIFAPGVPSFSNPSGTINVDSLSIASLGELEFDLDTPDVFGSGVNDLIIVDGPLVLDGLLNIYALDNFGPGTYTLIQYSGTLTNNGLDVGYHLLDYPYEVFVNQFPGGGGEVLLSVPEPSAIGAILALATMFGRRRR